MKNPLITDFEKRYAPQVKIHPKFRPGDTLRVNYKIEEAAKTADGEKKYRIQAFEGVCIRFKKGTMDSSLTVRKIGANSVGVERTFPMNSPYIDSIEVMSGGRVRRSRLYYLRALSGKSARIRARRLPAGTQMKTIDPNAVAQPKKKEKKKKK
ncbi:MAG: 50S ribosomal protein L19 [Zetaproteobacteria bacterium]|nr:50S ribosomal protein L19 [Zetaproteobacteria bacterium]